MISGTFKMKEEDFENVNRLYEIIKTEYDSDNTSEDTRDLCRELESFETYAGQLMINAMHQYLNTIGKHSGLFDEI